MRLHLFLFYRNKEISLLNRGLSACRRGLLHHSSSQAAIPLLLLSPISSQPDPRPVQPQLLEARAIGEAKNIFPCTRLDPAF